MCMPSFWTCTLPRASAHQQIFCTASCEQAEAHLQVLAGMEVGLQSMEVVSRLAARPGPLPPGFLQAYLANCIASCEAEPVWRLPTCWLATIAAVRVSHVRCDVRTTYTLL